VGGALHGLLGRSCHRQLPSFEKEKDMMEMLRSFAQQFRQQLLQSASLIAAQAALLIIGLGIKYIQTQSLTADNFGLYSFFISFLTISTLFFRFGLFSSVKNLLAENQDRRAEKELFGSGILLAIVIGLLYALFLLALSPFIDAIFDIDSQGIFKTFTPFFILFPIGLLLKDMCTGSNRINLQVLTDLLSKLTYLFPIYLLFRSSDLHLEDIIFWNFLGLFIAYALAILLLKPSFQNSKKQFKLIYEKTKSFGFPFYLGLISNQGSYQIDKLLIAYFITPVQVGFYVLAELICSPMHIFSQSLSNAMYKRFAHLKQIPKALFLINTLGLVIYVLLLYFLGSYLVLHFFGEAYIKTQQYLLPLAVAVVFQGLYQPFNFLTAQSLGKEIRNIAWMETAINLIGNIIFIPLYGVMGAIGVSIIAKGVHFGAKYRLYRQFIKES
jgi:O-antigen/teichoic acid export membrane protein